MNQVLRNRTAAYIESEIERDIEQDLLDLESAEDFLNYFQIPFAPSVVASSRLHILQRFHNYLSAHEAGKAPRYKTYQKWLAQAYADFENSSALDERVFAVLQRAAGTAYVSPDIQIRRGN